MRRAAAFSLSVILIVGGAILIAGPRMLNSSRSTKGEIRVPRHVEARYVLFPVKEGSSNLTHEIEDLSSFETIAEIPFEKEQERQAWLRQEGAFAAVRLPFSLTLESTEVLDQLPAADLLEIRSEHGTQRIPIAQGQQVGLGPRKGKIVKIGPWSGLYRTEHGMPMAAVALRSRNGGRRQQVLLAGGTRASPAPDVALRFVWGADEKETRRLVAENVPGIDTARWGVADGELVQWFSSFAPGTGLDLRDGRCVTLVDYDPRRTAGETERPAICVRVQSAEGEQRYWVFAGETDPQGLVQFRYEALARYVFCLGAWREGQALVAAFHSGEKIGDAVVEAGQDWRPDSSAPVIHIEQVLASAVPVMPGQANLRETVIEIGGRTLRVREGEQVLFEGVYLKYLYRVPPPVLRYQLEVQDDQGRSVRVFVLGPGDRVQVGEWLFGQARPAPEPQSVACLSVQPADGLLLDATGVAALACGVALGAWTIRCALCHA